MLAVGGIEPRKGTLDLVEAYAAARGGACPTSALVVAGGETLFDYRDYRAAVDARAAALGVEPVVLGPVPDDELPALVAGAAAFAFPSTKEGFGLAAMEALAAGVPLVAPRPAGAARGVRRSGRFAGTPAGIAAALAAALTVDDPERQAAGRRTAAAHSWDRAALAHLEFYRAHLRARV